MQKWMLVAAAVAVLVVGGRSMVNAVEDKVPSIEEIMKKVNKGPKSLHQVMTKQLKGDAPVWEDLAKMSKEYAALCGALGSNKCEVGEAKSWEKLCKEYAAEAKALDAAVAKMDKTASLAAIGKLNKTCEGCHDAHR